MCIRDRKIFQYREAGGNSFVFRVDVKIVEYAPAQFVLSISKAFTGKKLRLKRDKREGSAA